MCSQKLTLIAKYYSDIFPTAAALMSSLSPEDVRPHILLKWTNSKKIKLRAVISRIAPSIVAVSTFKGVERKVDCSGLIIEWDAKRREAFVLTSAKLLRFPANAKDYCVIVRLANGKVLLGEEDFVDYYHNILILKIKPDVKVEVIDLRASLAPMEHIEDGMDVIALGREFYSCWLHDSVGELYREYPYFGCEELWRSTCGTSQVTEGGPLITTEGHVVGVDFYDSKGFVHPLPTRVVLACLGIWKSHGTVVWPWFGLTVVDADQLPHALWEKLNLPSHESCVVVNEVYEGSPAKKQGVRPGDLVSQCDGIKINSSEEYSKLQCERSNVLSAASGNQGSPKVVIRPSEHIWEGSVEVSADIVAVNDKRYSCCWPLDDTIWSRTRFRSQKNNPVLNTWLDPSLWWMDGTDNTYKAISHLEYTLC